MSGISSIYINALLADAAYVDLSVGIIGSIRTKEKDDLSKRMTAPIGKIHSRQFRSRQTASGFQALSAHGLHAQSSKSETGWRARAARRAKG